MEKRKESNNDFAITRVFNAPRKTIFKAFTEPEHLAHWWGPKGFKLLVAKLDLRPGGTFHYKMSSPEGHEMWGIFVYREIKEPEKIVFINSFSDEKGGLTRHPMAPTWPLEVHNTLTLTEENGKTTLTLRGGPINASEEEMQVFAAGHSSMQQ
ncbi:MAG TPA: SRPBCC domain-containing protein, partial [Bacteroidia bacterium]|nr:SRPBCC domain-containing protein [Bacteroidia bacterium]